LRCRDGGQRQADRKKAHGKKARRKRSALRHAKNSVHVKGLVSSAASLIAYLRHSAGRNCAAPRFADSAMWPALPSRDGMTGL